MALRVRYNLSVRNFCNILLRRPLQSSNVKWPDQGFMEDVNTRRDDDLSFHFQNLNAVPMNSAPGKFRQIMYIE